MRSSVSFVLDGRIVTEHFSERVSPTTTVLNYLRSLPKHKGVKEGCAEGDCGACTVALGELNSDSNITYKAIDSCLVFLPMIHGKHLVTVENLKLANGELHPVQQAMVETGGSQCGYCTPGIVMSMFSLYKNQDHPTRHEIDDALTGNLCRCTGYKPIIEAAARSCVHKGIDSFSSNEVAIRAMLRMIEDNSALIATGTQSYFQPKTLLEALTLKHQHPDAIVICGATDVALRVTKRHELLSKVLDLSCIVELRSIRDEGEQIRIGAGVPLSELHPIVKKAFPPLAETLDVFGSLQIRNLATLGGNLGSASPIGDTLSALIPSRATVVLQNVSGKREVLLDEYVTGYRKTVRTADELIVEVILPKLGANTFVKWYKVSKRKDLDISTVSAGFRLELNGSNQINSAMLVYGGMAERVKRATTAEKFLQGKNWSRQAVDEAMLLIDKDFTPISDARGSAEFRTIAARNLLLKFWTETL